MIFHFRSMRLAGLLLAAAAICACSTVPDSIVEKPAVARNQPMARPVAGNGAIIQLATYRPMFEDRRARMVGDILVIAIVERTTATKSAEDTGSRSGSATAAIPRLFGLKPDVLDQATVSAAGASKFEQKGAASTGNTFSGSVSVSVIEVLQNGYLVVSGEKQVALDKGIEYIRFSGVVNPDNITAANTVSSIQVADARVEYRTNSRLDKAEVMSQLTRFFLSVLPL